MKYDIVYGGDNLEILRCHDKFPTNSIDLAYLDPPFNSGAVYNGLLLDEDKINKAATKNAFDDTFKWNSESDDRLSILSTNTHYTAIDIIHTEISLHGKTSMANYLLFMLPRLYELYRVLKSTGSIYLHCDPTASHYLKIIMDIIFGRNNFRNEISWLRSHPKNGKLKQFGKCRDIILFYSKAHKYIFNQQFMKLTDDNLSAYKYEDERGIYSSGDLADPHGNPRCTYRFTASNGVTYDPPEKGWRCTKENMQKLDDDGELHFPTKRGGRLRRKQYLKDSKGTPVTDAWNDIPPIGSHNKERTGYPTQKPLALLERIIRASSNPGDIVLDPFCGSGTTLEAAGKLGRHWIGIDAQQTAISMSEKRMFVDNSYYSRDYIHEHKRIPTTVEEFTEIGDSFGSGHATGEWFERTAVMMINGGLNKPGKGSDDGIDGFVTEETYGYQKGYRGIISCKYSLGIDEISNFYDVMIENGYDYGLILCRKAQRKFHQRAAEKGMRILTIIEADQLLEIHESGTTYRYKSLKTNKLPL